MNYHNSTPSYLNLRKINQTITKFWFLLLTSLTYAKDGFLNPTSKIQMKVEHLDEIHSFDEPQSLEY